ncbi:MAG: ornithine--oxo-acid transaminase [Edaphobacter sp.]|uniref:ornithine--oxo-acid transaminase n=1 Tax=Edaphobacter sp. TaxID=1934404 RepID=UPI002389082C|nr:ornithine--oxo-acid transaminase [Edaphobacter sp.]MDE1176650.1 ornithine--oxo-acid transaminase [Edaphobacter sp.]
MASSVLHNDTAEDHTTQNTTTSRLIALEDKYGAHNYKPLDVVVERASGCWVYDVEGRKYLDLLAAYSAVNQGHCHPRILAAMQQQAERVTLTSRAFRNDQLPLFLKELSELTGFEMTLPMNSGTEAVETAIKLARKWGYKIKGIPEGKAEIIVCENNFHGRTISIISFSTEEQYRDGFGPYLAGFKIIPFGDAAALRAAITPNTAAFLVEPIQGEAGVLIPPDGFLAEAAKICRENNVLFIADEIQSGLGRTGKMFAYQHEDLTPDMLIVGKALAGGFYPVSAVLASKEIIGIIHPGDHGSTFGGNPMACAVARESLRVIVDEKLCERSAELGKVLMDKLSEIKSPNIRQLRGKGLWVAIELNGPARPICEALMREGILCKETHDNVIRIAPPLTIEREDLLWACEHIKAVLESN